MKIFLRQENFLHLKITSSIRELTRQRKLSHPFLSQENFPKCKPSFNGLNLQRKQGDSRTNYCCLKQKPFTKVGWEKAVHWPL